jgi:aspartate-semialdehyde dehydrogenase
MNLNKFVNSLEDFANNMEKLENEHKAWFSIEENIELENKKEDFANNVIFWIDSNCTKEEKVERIKWEYNNMFDFLVNIINNNVDKYNNL